MTAQPIEDVEVHVATQTCEAEHAIVHGIVRCARAPEHKGMHMGLIERVLLAGMHPSYALYEWPPGERA